MNDDQMDELLIQGVRDYNAPRDVPREEMWKRIAEARAEARRNVAPATPAATGRSQRRWLWPGVGVAAAAVLAAGIGIGRFIERGAPAPTAPVAAATPALSIPKSETPDTAAQTQQMIEALRGETRATDQRARDLAAAENAGRASSTSSGNDRSPSANAPSAAEPNLAFRLVMLRHLAGSEAMITAFRSDARRGDIDREMAQWSRELLSTTRLLESSQASRDPVMRRLLEDLDLVISQIVQYTTRGTTDPEELEFIEQSINKRGVMSKLRSTIPARGIPAGT
jgi:hypothetical protein